MYRKLIKAGPVSLATALPASWIRKHNVKAGDSIRVEESKDTLIVTAERQSNGKIKIKYDSLLIESMLEKLFWEQYGTIVIYDDNNLPKDAVARIRKLPGFEAIDVQNTSITIERILEPAAINPENITKRCYVLIKQAMESNPPSFDKETLELLAIARLFKQESREAALLIEAITTISQIKNRIYDDTFVHLKNMFTKLYEQKVKYRQSPAQEFIELHSKIDSIFEQYFATNKRPVELAKAYHVFSLVNELNKEIIRKQSVEMLMKVEDTKASKKFKVGVCLKNRSNTFWGIEITDGMNAGITSNKDIDLHIKYPLTDFNIEEQEQILNEFLLQGVNIIIFAPIDPQKLEKTLKRINKANIPLVVLDTDLEITGITYKFIGFDNYEGGRLTAQYLKKRIKKKGDIIVLEGHLKGNFSKRVEGFLSVFSKENTVVLKGEFIGSVAYETIKEYAERHKIAAVFGTSDNMAIGAADALAEQGISVPICGFDATKEGKLALSEGKLLSSVNTKPHQLGELAVQVAHDILSGRTVAEKTEYAIEFITKA